MALIPGSTYDIFVTTAKAIFIGVETTSMPAEARLARFAM